MKVSLRKANALQRAITEAAKAAEPKVTVEINEFVDAKDVFEQGVVALTDTINRRVALSDVLYDIRKDVANANTSAGINDMLNEVARLESRVRFYEGLARNSTAENIEVIAAKQEKLRNMKDEAYRYLNSINTTVLTTKNIEDFKAFAREAKKQKQAVQDKLLELNIKTEIELSAFAVETLTKEGLI